MFTWWVGSAGAADTFESSALLAMGRVGVASSRENASLTLNPGLLALDQRYDFQGQFRYGPQGALAGGLNAVDARTSDRVAGGLAYTGDTAEPEPTVDELPGWIVPGEEIQNKKTSHDVAFGAAVPWADRRVSFGLGGTVGWYHTDRFGNGWRADANAGVGVRPTEGLTLGVSARNFIPTGALDRPLEVLAGARTDFDDWPALEVDVGWRPDSDARLPLDVGAGFSIDGKAAAVRAGWRRDALGDVHSVGAGVAVLGPGSALEYGTLVPVTGDVRFDRTIHQLTLRFSAAEPIPEPR